MSLLQLIQDQTGGSKRNKKPPKKKKAFQLRSPRFTTSSDPQAPLYESGCNPNCELYYPYLKNHHHHHHSDYWDPDDGEARNHHHHENNLHNHNRHRPERRLGERIARKRAFSAEQKSSSPAVVYRRPEDWTNPQSYGTCLYLDPHDTVLACDWQGKMDIVRLSSSSYSSSNENATTTTTSTSLSGICLASELEISSSSSYGNRSSSLFSFSSQEDCGGGVNLKFHSIDHGKYLCVGMPSGDFHVLATERLGSSSSPSSSSSSFQKQQSWNSFPDSILSQKTPFSSTTSSSSPPQAYITQGWKIAGPRRKYARDRRNGLLSLSAMMMQSHNTSESSHTYLLHPDRQDLLTEYYNHDESSVSYTTSGNIRFVPYQRQPPKSSFSSNCCWDFRDTASGALLAAHVNREHDSFWMRVLDDRQPPSSNSSTILIDTTAQDRAPSMEEHITSIAWCSEYALATSHVWSHTSSSQLAAPASSFFEDWTAKCGTNNIYQPTNTCIKIWDLRMVRKGGGGGGGGGQCDTISLPSFPEDGAVGMEPAETLFTKVDENDRFCIYPHAEKSHQVITQLQSSPLCPGSMVVTTQSRAAPESDSSSASTTVSHYRLDLTRQCFTRHIAQRSYNNSSDEEGGCSFQALSAVSGSHSFFASLDYCQSSSSAEQQQPSMRIYNLDQEAPKQPKRSNNQVRQRLGGKKRTFQGKERGGGVNDDDDRDYYDDDGAVVRFQPKVQDRHGLDTQLSCLALNDSGTAIVGGSSDGDLFVWRGI